ncbi:lectin, partial [Mycena leptocephala]
SASSWIWTNEATSSGAFVPAGSRAFRKDWVAPLGKVPGQAGVLITADDSFTFYSNGQFVGIGADFHSGEHFCIALQPCLNVFAVTAAKSSSGPAGLLVAIQILYSDGTIAYLASDHSWVYSPDLSVPSGYEQPTYDDNSWLLAIPQGKTGVSPWGQPLIDSALTGVKWIWSDDVVNGLVPAGNRTFRRTFGLPSGQTGISATITIIADDAYTLYVNGVQVGSYASYTTAQTYNVKLSPTPNVVFAVNAANFGGPAGLLVGIQFNNLGNPTCTHTFASTDEHWKYNTGVPTGFQLPTFNDSDWPAAVVEGAYGMAPWGNVQITQASGTVNA